MALTESNESLVEFIQQGKTDLYLSLWDNVKGYIAARAYRRLIASRGFDGCRGHGGVEVEDLVQAGYFAMVEAAKTYRPESASFITWLDFYLLKEFRTAEGIRTSKRDPLDEALSLDRPRGEDEDETIGDHIKGADRFVGVDETIYISELRAALEKALTEIPQRQAEILRKTEWENRTLQETGKEIGVSTERARQLRRDGLAAMRNNRGLREFLQDEINYYIRVGKDQFNSTRQSSTELLALRILDLEQKYKFLLS